MSAPVHDDNELAILRKLPDDPRTDAKVVAEAPRIVTARDLLESSLKRAEQDVRRQACTTGNAYLDEKTGGFLPGWSWVFGAPTNWGKSLWAISVADENLQLGRGVLIVSLEDTEELYGDRLMLRRCCNAYNNDPHTFVKVRADAMRLGNLSSGEKLTMRAIASKGERKPVFMDARALKGERIAKDIGRILDNVPIDLVILDYLQEVHSAKEHNSTRDKVSEMARAIRQEVKSRNRSLVIVSQVTVGDDPDKWPRMNQIRDSRDVVNAAEVVVMAGTAMQDIDVNSSDGTLVALKKGERGLRIEKVKQGKKGLVKLPWDDEAACFLPVSGGLEYDDRYPDDKPSWAIPRDGDVDFFDDLDSGGRDMAAGR
jgi:replicative DNA helicase